MICHAAMVARELGVPAVVVRGATSLIPGGTLIELDADKGTVRILDKAKGNPDSASAQRDADFCSQVTDLGKNRKGKIEK